MIMNILESKNIIKKHFKYKNKVKNVLNEQIDKFYELKDKYSQKNNNYTIGDDVMLDEKTLIHGTRLPVSDLKIIKENGLIAPEFFSEYNKNKKKPFVVEFWNIEEKISLKDYINKYCGVTIDVKANNGNILKRIITSMSKIEKEILELSNYRDYVIYQNQEQRFLPNKYNDNATLAFILKEEKELEDYLKNDIFDINFDKKILKHIVPKWFYEKYMLTRNFDNYETGREKAILYGVPSNFIEGILVNKNIENNEFELEKIKEIFPKCYICNIDGKVIK